MCSCLRLFQRLCCCLCIFVVKCACYNWWGVNWQRCWWGEHGDKPVGGHGGRFHNSLPLSRDLPAQATTLPTWVRGMINDQWSVLIHIIFGKGSKWTIQQKKHFLEEKVGWWEIELTISVPSSVGLSLSAPASPWPMIMTNEQLRQCLSWSSQQFVFHSTHRLHESISPITYLFQRPSSLLFTIHTV